VRPQGLDTRVFYATFITLRSNPVGRWPQAVTGITDEAGVRYGTYAYDAQGRVTKSELIGGAERLDFAYTTDANGKPTTTVTDYSGAGGAATSRTYTFTDIGNVRYPSNLTAPCSLCGSTQQTSTYDANGNPTKQITHDGSVTFLAYDARGRETERAVFPSSYQSATTRPALGAATKVISTQWHATFNLPTQVAEPNKTTANTYNSKGLLTGTSWTATTDATGAAKFTAVKTGSTYATGWSYSASNLATTIVTKETAAGATTAVETGRWTTAYAANGDLTRVTDVTGGNVVARATSYDAHGKLLAGTSINGVALALGYNTRGQLMRRGSGAFSITFEYNPTGRLTFTRFSQGGATERVYDSSQNVVELRVDGRSLGQPGAPNTDQLTWLDLTDPAALRPWLAQLGHALRQGNWVPAGIAHAQVPVVIRPRTPPGPLIEPPLPGEELVPGLGDRLPNDNLTWSLKRGLSKAQARLTEVVDECVCKATDQRFPKPTYTNDTFEHVWSHGHHWSNSSPTVPGAGRFASGIGGQVFTDAVVSRAGSPVLQGTRLIYRAIDMGYVTGTDRAGRPTRSATVIVQGPCPYKWSPHWENEVITQFPGLL
jgi:YD repeat-containing protein